MSADLIPQKLPDCRHYHHDQLASCLWRTSKIGSAKPLSHSLITLLFLVRRRCSNALRYQRGAALAMVTCASE